MSGRTTVKPVLVILPFRDTARAALEALIEDLALLGFEASLLAEAEVPEDAYDRRRGQYHAEAFLGVARRMAGATGKRVLGVTDHDLYAEGLNFVFGLAESPGRAAVISLARLRQTDNWAQQRARAVKEAVHELGHTFGLNHCSDPGCVMHFSNTLADTDRKGREFCPSCRARLGG